MKKKVFFLVSFIMLTFSSFAETSFLESPNFNSGKALWILRAGINFNDAVGDWKDTQIDSWDKAYKNLPLTSKFPMQTGFNVSITFNKSFGQRPLYWGMELGLGTRGYKANAEWSKSSVSSGWGDVISHTVKQNITLCTYNVEYHPFIFGYKYQFLQRMAVDIHASAFTSFDFAGKSTVYNYDYQQSSNTPREKEKSNSVNINDMDKFKRLDAGLNIGVGYWFGHFNIDFSWQRGFIKMFDIDDSYNAQNLKLKLGYAF